MSKLKVLLLIILAAVLVDFAWENSQTWLVIKLFKFQLGEMPTFLVAYISLVVGLVIGWVAHGFRIRRKRHEAQARAQAASAEPQQ